MAFDLDYRSGLYYCKSDPSTLALLPRELACYHTVTPQPPRARRIPHKLAPTPKARQIESELWMLCFGSPGEHQLDVLPLHVTGTPPVFKYHPFWFIDFKEHASIHKKAAHWTVERIATCGAEFFKDFWVHGASTEDYRRPNKDTDRVVTSYDEYLSHLVIIDCASRCVWVFLTSTKEPPSIYFGHL